jgi:hypothetical protein
MTEKQAKTLKPGDWLFCTVGNEETQFNPFEQHPIKGEAYNFVKEYNEEYEYITDETDLLIIKSVKWNIMCVYPAKYFVKFNGAKEYKIVKTLYGVQDET